MNKVGFLCFKWQCRYVGRGWMGDCILRRRVGLDVCYWFSLLLFFSIQIMFSSNLVRVQMLWCLFEYRREGVLGRSWLYFYWMGALSLGYGKGFFRVIRQVWGVFISVCLRQFIKSSQKVFGVFCYFCRRDTIKEDVGIWWGLYGFIIWFLILLEVFIVIGFIDFFYSFIGVQFYREEFLLDSGVEILRGRG